MVRLNTSSTRAQRVGRRGPYFVDGNEKIAPSRTPADGQRWVIVFRFV